MLMGKNCEIYYCDFGLARLIPNNGTAKAEARSNVMQEIRAKLHPTDPAVKPIDPFKAMCESKSKSHRQRLLSPYMGTRIYRSPEMMLTPGQYD